MEIHVVCPELKCSRCPNETVVLPTVLRSSRHVSPVYVGGKTAVPVAGFEAGDESGSTWQVVGAVEPEGWGTAPGGARLCPECNAAWLETAEAFAEGRLSKKALRHLPKTRAMASRPVDRSAEKPVGVAVVAQKILPAVGKPPVVHHHVSQAASAVARPNVVLPNRATVGHLPAAAERQGSQVSSLPMFAPASSVAPTPAMARREGVAPVPTVVRGNATAVSPIPSSTKTDRVSATPTRLPAMSEVAPIPSMARNESAVPTPARLPATPEISPIPHLAVAPRS